ncbi:Protein lin-37 [Bulinus truncatus]|nr:Protein lin-37 [Bulinus truncatus]
MAGKNKQAEVTSARIRLDATLQHLVDRKDDSHENSEGESNTSVLESSSNKAVSSLKKSVSKPSKKRKRRDNASDVDNSDEQQTVIMKLFDRSVDLALFPEETPLYPVCRAWIQNRPHDKSLGTLTDRPISPKPEKEESDMYPYIYEMPAPIKSEDGCLYDLRIPEPLPQPDEKLDIHADPKSIPPGDQLLFNHMARWKEIRNRWRDASVMNEMQYIGSMTILKDMFDRSVEN